MESNSCLLIDTEALAGNVRAIREDLGEAELVAVVKGNAYGLGAVPITRELARLGVREFAVSHPSEGLELRRAAGHPAGGAEQGELLQADALAHGGCHAVRYRVLQNK